MTSDMTFGLVIVLIVVVCCLGQNVQSYLKNKVRNTIQYSHSGIVALPLLRVREALDKFYKSMACSCDCTREGAWVYQRGCILTFQRVDHTVDWHLVPQAVECHLDSESGKTRVGICYRVLPPVRITQRAANQFVKSARLESERALESLQVLAQEAAGAKSRRYCATTEFSAGL